MKYKTVIELVCEAPGKDDATNIAGEYLRGNVDFGVRMKSRTTSLCADTIKKYSTSLAVVCVVFLALMLQVTPIGNGGNTGGTSIGNSYGSYTVLPELKTKHKAGFKKLWSRKKEEAVMNYLKN